MLKQDFNSLKVANYGEKHIQNIKTACTHFDWKYFRRSNVFGYIAILIQWNKSSNID